MRDELSATIVVALPQDKSQLSASLQEARMIGALYYFTGIPCSRGHISKRFTSARKCVECCLIDRAIYRKRHPEKIKLENKLRWESSWGKEYRRNWRAENPHKMRQQKLARRAKEASAIGFHTEDDLRSLLKEQRGKCAYYYKCGARLKTGYHVDHIVALSRGGSNFRSNLQLLCSNCNCRKHAKDPISFAQELGFLI